MIIFQAHLDSINNKNQRMGRYSGILGVVVLLLIAYLMSNNKKKIDYKLVGWGLGLQLTFALFIYILLNYKTFFQSKYL